MLLLSAEWPRPLGRREILKWTKIWGILSGHALFAGWIWEEDILVAEIEELEKLDASETYPRRLNAKEALITQNSYFLLLDGSVKLSGRDYEFQEPTLKRKYTANIGNHRGESHGDREEFRPEEVKDDEGINEDFWAHAEARK